MNLSSLIRKPLIAAVLGAATIAVPAGALYMAGATRALATTAAAPPASTATPMPPASPASLLPDFSSMVQKYGPAVVNRQGPRQVRPGGGQPHRGHQGEHRLFARR